MLKNYLALSEENGSDFAPDNSADLRPILIKLLITIESVFEDSQILQQIIKNGLFKIY